MKHLRKFNEGISEYVKNDVLKISRDYLIYLYDEGVRIIVNDNEWMYKDSLYIEFIIPDLPWNDIKDYMIPYIEELRNNYEFIKINNYVDNYISFSFVDSDDEIGSTQKSIDDIINDNMDNLHDKFIYLMHFYLK